MTRRTKTQAQADLARRARFFAALTPEWSPDRDPETRARNGDLEAAIDQARSDATNDSGGPS